MTLDLEIAQTAARLIADDGLSWGAAKKRALKDLDLPPRTALPSNECVEEALREHLSLFQADTQPAELRALRDLALQWMDRLAEFDPLVVGAVWRGTANHWSDIHLELFADDAKAPEIGLLNAGERPEAGPSQRDGRGRDLHTLIVWARPPRGFAHPVAVHLAVLDPIDRRGALLPDGQGRTWRGDREGLRRLLESQ
ncbi:hypothetical protein [Inhella gelatinilytica]|uniref:Nucleotidyltransferase-like protein n=1 Tax=Inhella gelatinilytica TaxID=2795030 RepID=A0A931IX81_9BURK|nr:hypothetical protein [Inhella gelatinilytica]MBH9553226.1 hypothetical protein [Inhella gelatinilytica]